MASEINHKHINPQHNLNYSIKFELCCNIVIVFVLSVDKLETYVYLFIGCKK